MKRFRMKAYLLLTLIFAAYTLPGCGGDAGNGHWDQPNVIPMVSSTVPANNATGVAIGSSLTATFSEEMNSTTITDTTFTLMQGVTAITGTVTYSGVTAVFAPTNPLISDTLYTATITTGATDLDGNALASNYVWSFTTGLMVDAIAPLVASTVPLDLATDVATNTSVTATFSEAMNPATISTATFSVKETDLGTVVGGTVNLVGTTATFTPTNLLTANTNYTATVTTGAQDLAGNALAADKIWSFTTSAVLDTIAPLVTSTVPLDLATDVATDSFVTATFSEAMAPATISTATFSVKETLLGTIVAGNVNLVGTTATFTPTDLLKTDTSYTATVTIGAQDLAGNALAVDKVWSFTTENVVVVLPLGPAPVNLGTAGNFVILTKSGITTTGTTDITGDMGVSPIDSTAIEGFGLMLDSTNQFSTSSLVTGQIYAADYSAPTPSNMTTAISDMETAYIDAAGRTTPDGTELYAGNLSGQTFTAGLYKWSTGILVNAGSAVTLSGGANDVWIFQIAGDITMSSGAAVTLVGGAQAKNIFWQVGGGTGVTFEPASAFQGIVLAEKAIVFKDEATLNGRALAQTNVTLISNTITAP
ncbi:MAG: DUF3494 domain-containing protein [Desulfuromonadales bacterium]|nr:DUF3494 domain-containing protein [Desulfuromonadales bacterium]